MFICSQAAKLDYRKKAQGGSDSSLRDELTVVTAFFNIGPLQKADRDYYQWMKTFAHIDNPLIIYVDSDVEKKTFTEIRKYYPSNRTLIIKLAQEEMWAFKLVPRIDRIFRLPGYPQFQPNTVNAKYSAAMHAKYEVMEMSVRANPFKTNYFCWVDVGLFRSMPRKAYNDTTARFGVYLPKNFRPSEVAYSHVRVRNPKLTPMEIVAQQGVWVCGCFFVARSDVMLRWTAEYRAATEKLIRDEIMSTDQQVIYAMFNAMSPSISLQLYPSDGRYNEWFHLGYISRDAQAERIQRKSATTLPTPAH